jgi:hypothetical protein
MKKFVLGIAATITAVILGGGAYSRLAQTHQTL